MKIRCRKILRIIFLFIAFIFLSKITFAQLTIGTVDPGPYTQGSTIAATFTIGGALNMKQGNVFELYLSDATGNFATETLIGSYSGFYSTFVNGTIPMGTPPGTGYKVRIKSNNPISISNDSAPFAIKNGTSVQAKLTSTFIVGNPEVLGTCAGEDNKVFYLKNESTAGSTTTASITDEVLGGTSQISFPTNNYTFNAHLAHYTIVTRAEMPDGTVATKANLLINNDVVTAFSTVGNNIVCIPAGLLKFKVSTVDLEQNFPGNMYLINWGDGTSDQYTLSDLKMLGTFVTHTYLKSSCGNISTTSSGKIYNSFDVSIKVINDFCGDVGTPISSYAKVVIRPINKFTAPASGCIGVPVTFLNKSERGVNPNTTSADCVPNDITYNWFVDGVLIEVNMPISYNFEHTFTTTGEHTIRLESINQGVCNAEPFEQKICIQNPPNPVFSLPQTTICAPGSLKVKNLSVVDNICNNVNYSWTVTPAVNYSGGTDNASLEPEFVFDNPGIYTITLNITSACGLISSQPQTVVVNETPTINLSPDITLCNLATYDFSASTLGATKTTFTGTYFEKADTYTWSITGGAYSFENGTGANSKYPSIKFENFLEYTVNVTHQNNCGTETKSQKIKFNNAPEVNAGNDQSICFNETSFSLTGSVTGATTSYSWVGGNGTFNPSANDLNAVYTPTALEKSSGSVTLQLIALTALAAPCNKIPDEIILTIKPDISITSISTKSICTGKNISYTPTNNVAGSIFNWTANPSANAVGSTASGSGDINDVLTNSDPLNDATVIYTITPNQDGCDGTPFTFTATITPNAEVSFTAPIVPICKNTTTNIVLTSNIIGTKYTYTSTAVVGVTGNSERTVATTVATIDDILTNTGISEATVTYKVTPISANGCDGDPVTIIIKVLPSPTVANSGADDSVCNSTTYTLKGNNPEIGLGKWTAIMPPNAVNFTDETKYNTDVNGLIPGNTYEFKWTISDNCSSNSDNVIITINKLSYGGTTAGDATFCSPTNTGSIGLSGQTGQIIRWESSIDGTNWIAINSTANPYAYSNLEKTTQFRAVVVNGNCAEATSTASTITILPSILNNTVTDNQTICVNETPLPLSGSLPTGGNGNYTYQWQSSTDGVVWLDIDFETNIGLVLPKPTTEIFYRRIANNGTCIGALQSISNVVKITLNPHAKAEFTYANDRDCAPFVLKPTNISAVPYPDRNATYTWYANNVIIGTGTTFPGYTITNDNETVSIKLVTTSSLNCNADEMSHNFSTPLKIVASFTQLSNGNCSPLAVTFTNTSTSLTDATFEWNFGNGTTSNLATPPTINFLSRIDGRDTTYTVTLKAITACEPTTATSTIFVAGNATSIFSPNKTLECTGKTIIFNNFSPGSTNTYKYDFDDGSPILTVTDKNPVNHIFNTPVVRDYIVKLTVENSCGISVSSHIIRIFPDNIIPSFFVNGNNAEGCAPLLVNFQNNTQGASNFIYDFGDGGTYSSNGGAIENIPHTFTQPGNYIVKLYASNNCFTAPVQTINIKIYAQPTVSFNADKTIGCDGEIIKFKNTSADAISYIWDFGDGTTSDLFEPTHLYSGSGASYTVSLTAKNSQGCPKTTTMLNYINIAMPPIANFIVNPANEISIPDYNFRFSDTSIGAAGGWEWNFGDGTTSTQQNPTHTYDDVGIFNVTLKVINANGCPDITNQEVRIIGVPGYLNLPNSFMPASAKNELRTFKAKGRGIQEYHMTVFNKWGKILWETTKIDQEAPAEGWDGTYQGVEQPQGVYYWKIELKFLNGGEWKGMTYDSAAPKKTGMIYLIR